MAFSLVMTREQLVAEQREKDVKYIMEAESWQDFQERVVVIYGTGALPDWFWYVFKPFVQMKSAEWG